MRMYGQKIIPFSVQEVLSCGGNGCQGGYFKSVYDYVQASGVGPSISYPYDSTARYMGTVATCKSVVLQNQNYSKNKVMIRKSVIIPKGDCYSIVE